jgi:FkbM family methyltransferase
MSRIKEKIKSILLSNLLMLSAYLSVKRKAPISVIQDLEGDFVIKTQSSYVVSSSPYSVLDLNDISLFEYTYKVKSGDNIVICGVEDGLELEYFAAKCSPGILLAVECTPACIRRIKKTIRLNKLDNVVLVPVAAGDCESFSYLEKGPTDLSNRLIQDKATDLRNELETVRVCSLTSIIEENGLSSIDYLKLNVEGAEYNALCGLKLQRTPVMNFCISCHDFIGPDLQTYALVKKWLIVNKYEVTNKPLSTSRFWDNYYLFAKAKWE